MKIDSSSLKPFTTDVVPAEFTGYLEKLKNADASEFIQLLDKAHEWCNVFGKVRIVFKNTNLASEQVQMSIYPSLDRNGTLGRRAQPMWHHLGNRYY